MKYIYHPLSHCLHSLYLNDITFNATSCKFTNKKKNFIHPPLSTVDETIVLVCAIEKKLEIFIVNKPGSLPATPAVHVDYLYIYHVLVDVGQDLPKRGVMHMTMEMQTNSSFVPPSRIIRFRKPFERTETMATLPPTHVQRMYQAEGARVDGLPIAIGKSNNVINIITHTWHVIPTRGQKTEPKGIQYSVFISHNLHNCMDRPRNTNGFQKI